MDIYVLHQSMPYSFKASINQLTAAIVWLIESGAKGPLKPWLVSCCMDTHYRDSKTHNTLPEDPGNSI